MSQVNPVGTIKRGGRWRLDRDTHVGTVLGAIKLDLRGAEIAAPEVELHVQATPPPRTKLYLPATARATRVASR